MEAETGTRLRTEGVGHMGKKVTAVQAALTLAGVLPALDGALETTPHRSGTERSARRACRPSGFPAPARRAAALQTRAAQGLRAERARLLRACRALSVPVRPMELEVGAIGMALQVHELAKRLEADARASRALDATATALTEMHREVTRFFGGPESERRPAEMDPAVVVAAAAELKRRAALLTTAEVAERAGVTPGCVRVAAHRARQGRGGLAEAGRRFGQPLYDPADVDAMWPPRSVAGKDTTDQPLVAAA